MTSSPPALPTPSQAVLASSLLSLERKRLHDQQHQWQTGVPSLDKSLPSNLWTSGKVIGIIDDSDSDATTASSKKPKVPLIAQLMVTHLASLSANSKTSKSTSTSPSGFSPHSSFPPKTEPEPETATAIFIVTPPTSPSSPLSPSSLANHLTQSSLPPSLLDSVFLLQYLDFPGLADAVAEVTACLFRTHHDHSHNHPQHRHSHEPTHHHQQTAEPEQPHTSIVIVDGLIPTLTSLTRSSGPVATNALLVPLLRSLSLLSRTNPRGLVLVILEREVLEGLSKGGGAGGRGGGEQMSAFSSYSEERRDRDRERERERAERSVMGMAVGQRGYAGARRAGAGVSVNPSLVSVVGVLASGVDVLVLVHKVGEGVEKGGGGGRDVVEVLVDRVGDGVGVWGVR